MKKKSLAIERVMTDGIEWVHLSDNRPEEMRELTKRYGIHPIDAQDILPPIQRPKVVRRADYVFMILLYPRFDDVTQAVYLSEVDFFLSPTRLITVNTDDLPRLRQRFVSYLQTSRQKNVCAIGTTTQLLYSILDDLLNDAFPLVLQLSAHSDAIEQRLFQDFEKDLIQDLLRVKTNIVNVRRSIQGHKHTLRTLIVQSKGLLPFDELQTLFERLIEQNKEIWDVLEIERETINALHETNASLIDYRINEIMKMLTIVSVILFPLSLIASIFGMNAINMPVVNSPYGFWIILSLMAVGVASMLLIFKYKKWL